MNIVEPTNFIEEEINKDLESGKAKEVITRFPPEPSGYWHIGHCKAITIDFETAKKYGGYTYLRMDDTSQQKKMATLQTAILLTLNVLDLSLKNLITQVKHILTEFMKSQKI